MRDRMERLVLLPFSVGCISESSIAVAVQHHQPRRSSKPPPENNSSTIRKREEDEESVSSESMKNSFRFLASSKPEVSNGFHRLCKSFKNLSQLFVYKEEMDELEKDMEIGFPTDVKHVTHIGIDGCTTTQNNNNSIKSSTNWDNLIAPGLLSLGQFELSMAAAAAAEAEAPAEALVKSSINQQLN